MSNSQALQYTVSIGVLDSSTFIFACDMLCTPQLLFAANSVTAWQQL